MKLLGLTGGIGMGKSAAAGIFTKLSASVVDTDALARLVVEPGQPALLEIQRRFGAQILVSSLQQTTTVHGNNGDGIPGSKVKDNKSGPALNIEFRLHF